MLLNYKKILSFQSPLSNYIIKYLKTFLIQN
ncbi:hypothetical protein [Campylobacter phage CJLB-12]|nr:hypothetical protein [Campylobacter phage CJLB-12]QXO06322.1 hypothetical protein [Campylobacter phage CJLB-14]